MEMDIACCDTRLGMGNVTGEWEDRNSHTREFSLLQCSLITFRYTAEES